MQRSSSSARHAAEGREKDIHVAAEKIQSSWRGKAARDQLARQQAATCRIQAVARGFVARKKVQNQKRVGATIQEIARRSMKHEDRLHRLKEKKQQLLSMPAREANRAMSQQLNSAAASIQALFRKKQYTSRRNQALTRREVEARAVQRLQRMFRRWKLRRARLQRTGPPKASRRADGADTITEIDDAQIMRLHKRIQSKRDNWRPMRPVSVGAVQQNAEKAQAMLLEHKKKWLASDEQWRILTHQTARCAKLRDELLSVRTIASLQVNRPKPKAELPPAVHELHRKTLSNAERSKWWHALEDESVIPRYTPLFATEAQSQ